MKKVIRTVALITVLGMVASCDKPVTCKYEPFAPAGAEISWTDYNSVTDLITYFRGHDSTLLRHVGDTIKAYGYYRWVNFGGRLGSIPLFMTTPDYSSETAIQLEFPQGGPIQLDTVNMVYIEAVICASRTYNDCYNYLFTIRPL